MNQRVALTDSLIVAVSRLVDDSQTGRRDPSHADLQYCIERAGLADGDPNTHGPPAGKERRVRGTLSWALEYRLEAGEQFIGMLIDL